MSESLRPLVLKTAGMGVAAALAEWVKTLDPSHATGYLPIGIAVGAATLAQPVATALLTSLNTYLGESGAADFENRFLHRKAYKEAQAATDPKKRRLNHDIHLVSGITIETLIRVYAEENATAIPDTTAWLAERLEHVKTRWAEFSPDNTPELDFLQGRFVGRLYKEGAEGVYDADRLKSDEWDDLLCLILTGHTRADRLTSAIATVPELSGLCAFVAENYAPSFTYLLRHAPEAHRGVVLFLLADIHQTTINIHQSLETLRRPQPELTRWENRAGRTEGDYAAYLFERRIGEVRGREGIFDALEGFLADPRPFVWARMTGPAGSGKSRLALEACDAATGWSAGFLESAHSFSQWDTWEPLGPTLLVLDYALLRSLKLGGNDLKPGEFLLRLGDRFTDTNCPVRVLLLDRDAPDAPSWESLFRGTGDSSLVRASEWKDKPLVLSPPDDDARAAILQEELTRLGVAPPQNIQTLLRSLEERLKEPARPLFLYFAARAIADGLPEAQWSADGLIAAIFEREQRRWDTAGIDGAHLNAVVLATVLGNLTLATLPDDLKTSLYLPQTGKDAPLQVLGTLTDGYDIYEKIIRPLRPDLLGETLVLKRALGKIQLGTEAEVTMVIEQTHALIAAAWTLDAPATAAFLDRLAEHFLRAPKTDSVTLKAILELCWKPTDSTGRLLWTFQLADRLAFEFAWSNNVDIAKQIVAETNDLESVLLTYAQGLVNIMGSPDANVVNREEYLPELRTVASLHCNNEELQLTLAKSLYNITASPDATVAKGEEYLPELRTVASLHRSNEEIQLMLVYGLVNLMGSPDTAVAKREEHLPELRAIASLHCNKKEIQLQFAKGIVKLMGFPDVFVANREKYMPELRAIASIHRNSEEIQLLIATGLFSITASPDATVAKSEEYLPELRAIASLHPNNEEIQLQLAKGLVNLMIFPDVALAKHEKYLSELRTVTSLYPNNAEIQLMLVYGLVNITACSNAAVAKREEYLSESRTVASLHRNNKEIQLKLAEGLVNVMGSPDAAVAKREEYLPELRAIASLYCNNEEIQITLAQGLTNVMAAPDATVTKGEEYLPELRTIASLHRNNEGIQFQFAKGLFSIISCFDTAVAKGEEYLSELRTVATLHPTNEKIQIEFAKGLVNMIAANDADYKVTARCLVQIERVVQNFPKNIEIRGYELRLLIAWAVRSPNKEDWQVAAKRVLAIGKEMVTTSEGKQLYRQTLITMSAWGETHPVAQLCAETARWLK